MALLKFLHILTVVSLAVLHVSFDALPVNALSLEHGRDLGHAHIEIAKKRGQSHSSKKCRPRPSSASQSLAVSTTYHPNSAPSSYQSEPASTTSSSQSAATNAPASSGNTKVMYAWSNSEQPSVGNFLTDTTRMVYNWQLYKYPDININSLKNAEYVPTARSASDVMKVPSVVTEGYAKYCKFLNEPEISSQANVSPQEAFSLWMQYFESLNHIGIKTLGPAVTAAGIQWMETFLGLCQGHCTIYAIDYHYYGLEANDFISAVNTYHNLAPTLPVWITEIGCHDYSGQNQPCTQDVFNSFFPGAMGYAESTSWIEQIAWFGMFTTSEIPMGLETVNCMITCPSGNNADCEPNALGHQYVNYK